MVAKSTLAYVLSRTIASLPLTVKSSSLGPLWQGWRKSTWDACFGSQGSLALKQTEHLQSGIVKISAEVEAAVQRGEKDWHIIWNLPRPDQFLRDYCQLELAVNLKPWALARKAFFDDASDLERTSQAVLGYWPDRAALKAITPAIAEEAHLRGEQPDDPAIARHVPAARREPEHDETVETSAVKRRKLNYPHSSSIVTPDGELFSLHQLHPSGFAHEPSTRPAPSRPHHPDAHNRHSPERQLSFGAAKHYRVDKAAWEAGTHRW